MPSCLLADLHTDLMWSDQVRLLEIDTPRYFTDLLGEIGWPLTVTLISTSCDWKELGFGVIGAETLLTDPGHDSIDILLEVFYIIIIIDNLRALHSYPCDSYRQV